MVRYELTDYEWAAIRPMLPNKARGVRRGTTTCPQQLLLGAAIRRTMARDLPDCYAYAPPATTVSSGGEGRSVGADHGRTCRRSMPPSK